MPRISGKIENLLLPYEEKHPIIVAPNSYLTTLIIREAHQITLHGSNQETLAYIRREFWIVSGKKCVKKIVNTCAKCIRYKSQTAEQLIGQFLIGRELLTPPTVISEDFEKSRHRRWKVIQKMRKEFSRVWKNKYLHQLQQRYKWKWKWKWKELYTSNTWMFIFQELTRVAITCNGIRGFTRPVVANLTMSKILSPHYYQSKRVSD